MLHRLFFYRVRRLIGKCKDLYATTGSVRRTALYIAKFIIRRFGFAMRHLRSYRSATDAARQSIMVQPNNVPLVAIKVSGGIGDYIVIARYLRDLQASVEPFDFDIFCNYETPAGWIFSAVPGYHACYSEFAFDKVFRLYPLALRISQFVVAHEETADWLALKKHWRLVQALERIVQFRSKIDVFIQHHPFMDGFLAQKAVYMNLTRANFLHGMSKVHYDGDLLNLSTEPAALGKFGLKPLSYITVHNGYDPGFVITARQATKCYLRFDEIIGLLKDRFPHLSVVQIGTSTSIPIPGVDLDLVNRTSLPEVAEVIRNARLHLDNEGGLVHVAAAVGTKSCVIFGPTSADYFGYAHNINIRPKFCGGCWWTNETWMDQCPRGFSEARCMTEQDPGDIAREIISRLNDRIAGNYRVVGAVAQPN
jgi:hypothetical protein